MSRVSYLGAERRAQAKERVVILSITRSQDGYKVTDECGCFLARLDTKALAVSYAAGLIELGKASGLLDETGER